MKSVTIVQALLLASLLCLGTASWSQNAPGEDPVILVKRVSVQMSPIRDTNTSSQMQSVTDMPAWLKAKVARFEAMSNAGQTSGMTTDTDVTRTASSDGLKKTCIQEVGSTTTTTPNGGRGAAGGQQIVVLRGDLVNICK